MSGVGYSDCMMRVWMWAKAICVVAITAILLGFFLQDGAVSREECPILPGARRQTGSRVLEPR